MAADFVALHEPLVEWVFEQTSGNPTEEYVSITAFGELHGLTEQQSYQLLQTCKAWSLLDDRYVTFDEPAANLTPLGLQWVQERLRRRADPMKRAVAARQGLLKWLWHQKHEGITSPEVEGVLGSPFSLFEGERLTLREVDRAGATLRSKGLIAGTMTGQTEGPVLADITAEGQDCVEQYEGDISAYERRNATGNTTFNIEQNSGNIASNSSRVTQNAVTRNGFDPEKILEAVSLLQQLAPSLTPDADEQEELRAQAGDLQAAASDPASDRGTLRRLSEGLVTTLRRLAHSPGVQRLAIDAVERGVQSL
ncbi:hypothetical protein E6R18_28240 [Streptomyces sp. A1277]|uniref:hypothetical protein n=1 Tax=Streptomyces sp. A1277 TaxID=2563103 RepID=UPI0010A22E30|nr:hypothetical protein [Streptomyces sp. A1277]THA28442.1 hypothetical protein E6R18_28240 [Streptomyces sp. A1277]